ncbi:MAG: DUF2914 domain-containing protein [Kiloniellales bacterium]|nr:DUF2914 domain-containing protein [Kiloniellales bacterium]
MRSILCSLRGLRFRTSPEAKPVKGRWTLTLAAALLAATAAWQPAQAAEMPEVNDFVLTRGMVEREPSDPVDGFSSADRRGFAFARIKNAGEPTSVAFVWTRDQHHHATIHMNIGTSPAWRTWSSVNLQPGLWNVQVVSEAGQVLGQKSFRVMDRANSAISQVPPRKPAAPQAGGGVDSRFGSQ